MTVLTDIGWRDGDFLLDGGGHPALVTRVDVIRQDLVARLHCPPGAHWAWPDEGVDLSQYVQGTADPLTLLALRQDAEIGCEQDRRLIRADATITLTDLRTARVSVSAALQGGDALTLSTTIGGPRG